MNIDMINDIMAAYSEEQRELRIAAEYYDMMEAITDQYYAQMSADLDAIQYGMAA